MEHSASLGFQPGDAYPTIAWLDVDWWAVGTVRGRVRAFRTNYAGQSIVRGSACASSGRAPLIGVRRRPSAVSAENRARVTVARGPVGASAWLLVGFANQTTYAGLLLPIPLATVGLPGCALQVAPIITPFTTLGAAGIDAGYGFVDLNHSLSSTVTGTRVAAQWLLLDPANIQYGMSEVHELSLR
jgi:hypothetical protein